MPEQTIIIAPGNRTTLSLHMPNGTTIYNQDSNNAIWVGSNASLVAGQGMRIGPKGSLQWTTDNAQCFAVVDTGVASNVTVAISDNVQSLVNPVDVAVATATQLLAKGVPIVYTSTTFYGSSGDGFSGGNPGIFDVSAYGSATITLYSTVAQRWSILHLDAVGNVLDTSTYVTAVGSVPLTVILQIRSANMQINASTLAGSPIFTFFGTSRILTDRVSASRNPYFTSLNQAFTSGSANVNFPTTFISPGGQFYLRYLVTGTGKGVIGINYLDNSGNATTVSLVDSATGIVGSVGQETEKLIQLPPGVFTFYFAPLATATYTVQIMLIPS